MQTSEKTLGGGATNQVVKIGNTVRRQIRGGPVLHAYLKYLETAGMTGVPRFLGIDRQGREILSYLPGLPQGNGLPLDHPQLMADETIMDAASFLRRLHDHSQGFCQQQSGRDGRPPAARMKNVTPYATMTPLSGISSLSMVR